MFLIYLTRLFSVYTDAVPKIQKIILKNIQPLIKCIGMNSPKLLNIIKNFPQGSETLVLRILIILTDTSRPTSRLVSIVKTLFTQKRLDARCLIPIISGLEKVIWIELSNKICPDYTPIILTIPFI